jgi:hypothetical protein
VADELRHGPARRATRVALAGRLAQLPASELLPVWRRTLHALGTQPRREVVPELATLAPVLNVLAGPTADAELAARIELVSARWPLS